MKKFIVIAAVAAAMCAQAQEALPSLRVAGSVAGSDSLPLKDATITLLSLPDTLFVKSTLSDAEGRFDLGDVQSPEKFLLNVHAFNHDPSFLTLDGRPLHVTLNPSSRMLKEVVVRANAQPRLTMDRDKLVCVPTGMMLDAANAMRMLRLVPMLDVGRQSVNVLGRGNAKIYINGKDPHMPEDMLFAELRQLDPADVLKVEIITNPGASLSKNEGMAIVNIRLRNRLDGTFGSVNAEYYTHESHTRPAISGFIGVRRGKFSVRASALYAYEHINVDNQDYFDYYLLDRQVTNRQKGSTHGNKAAGAVNLIYEPTRRSRVGLSGSVSVEGTTSTIGTATTMVQGGVESLSNSFIRARTPMSRPSMGVVAFYDLQTDDRGSMLEVRADYGYNSRITKYDQYIGPLYRFERDYSSNEGCSGHARYTHIFSRSAKLTAGGRGYYGKLHRYEEGGPATVLQDYSDYDAEAFAQLNWSPGARFNVSAGLTLSYLKFDVKGTRPFSREDLNLIPNANLSFSIPAGNQIFNLSYLMRVSQPSYSELNPYVFRTSDNTFYQGNPNLKAAKSHHVQLIYNFLDGFIFQTSYGISTDNVSAVTINTADGQAMTTTVNCGKCNSFDFDLHYQRQFFRFWMLRVGAGASYHQVKVDYENYHQNLIEWTPIFNIFNTFTLSKKYGWSADLWYVYNPLFLQPEGKRKAFSTIKIGLDKAFPFGNLSLSCKIPTSRYYMDFWTNTAEYYRYSHKKRPAVGIYMSFRYTFGKKKTPVPEDNSQTTLGNK